MAKTAAEFHYEWFLHNVTIPAVSNHTTYGDDLQNFAKKMFGKRFHGVYMIDHIPHTLSGARPYAILNLDATSDPGEGSHWIAVAYHTARQLLVYDSFGQMHDVPEELKQIYGSRVTVTDPDAEQRVTETNCGARVLAWLLVLDSFGAKEAKHI